MSQIPSFNIKIHRCNEEAVAFPDIELQKELEFGKVAVIEQGMASGQTTLAFFFKDPESGKYFVAQTSALLMNALLKGVRGAEDHWAENPVENVWKK